MKTALKVMGRSFSTFAPYRPFHISPSKSFQCLPGKVLLTSIPAGNRMAETFELAPKLMDRKSFVMKTLLSQFHYVPMMHKDNRIATAVTQGSKNTSQFALAQLKPYMNIVGKIQLCSSERDVEALFMMLLRTKLSWDRWEISSDAR
jgi:hypothetical protein